MKVPASIKALDEKASSLILGLMRIIVGTLWLANIEWKRPPDFGFKANNGLYKYVDSAVRNPVLGVHKYFIQHVVLPNYTLFGWITLFTEVALAVTLILGWRTRLAALVGASMSINIGLSVLYYDKAAEWPWSYYLMFAAHLMIFAIGAGKHLGLDGVLKRDGAARRRALRVLGLVSVVVAILGFVVARNTGFAAKQGALLGWARGELKVLWFTPLSALLTLVFGALGVASAQLRRKEVGLIGAAGFAVMTLLTLLQWRALDAGGWTGGILGGTGANMAFWAMMALGMGLCALGATSSTDAVLTDVSMPAVTKKTAPAA
jgi:TQO small subunit DoxD